MGMGFDYEVVKRKMSGDGLKKWFRKHQEELRFEHGSSYTGTLAEKSGLHVTNKIFYSQRDAVNWIEEKDTDKWGPAFAVKVQETRKTPKSLENRLMKAQGNRKMILSMIDELQKSYRKKKEGRKKCQKCGSLINMKYAKYYCPVCGEEAWFFTDTQKGKMKKLEVRLKNAKKRIVTVEDAIKKHQKEHPIKGWYWVVGGWCSS